MRFSLILIILFSFFESLSIVSDVNKLSQLNISLASLNQKIKKEYKFLLGNWLIGKKIKDIMSDELINKLNIDPKDNVLVSFDDINKTYQLRVLRQESGDCAYHSIKNYVWLMEGLNSSLSSFGNNYFYLLSKDIYEEYQQATGCPKGGFYPEIIARKILNKKIACAFKIPRCIPQNSEFYVKNLVLLDARLGVTEKEEFIKEAKNIIYAFENVSDEKLAKDIAIFYARFSGNYNDEINRFYNQILQLKKF